MYLLTHIHHTLVFLITFYLYSLFLSSMIYISTLKGKRKKKHISKKKDLEEKVRICRRMKMSREDKYIYIYIFLLFFFYKILFITHI